MQASIDWQSASRQTAGPCSGAPGPNRQAASRLARGCAFVLLSSRRTRPKPLAVRPNCLEASRPAANRALLRLGSPPATPGFSAHGASCDWRPRTELSGLHPPQSALATLGRPPPSQGLPAPCPRVGPPGCWPPAGGGASARGHSHDGGLPTEAPRVPAHARRSQAGLVGAGEQGSSLPGPASDLRGLLFLPPLRREREPPQAPVPRGDAQGAAELPPSLALPLRSPPSEFAWAWFRVLVSAGGADLSGMPVCPLARSSRFLAISQVLQTSQLQAQVLPSEARRHGIRLLLRHCVCSARRLRRLRSRGNLRLDWLLHAASRRCRTRAGSARPRDPTDPAAGDRRGAHGEIGAPGAGGAAAAVRAQGACGGV